MYSREEKKKERYLGYFDQTVLSSVTNVKIFAKRQNFGPHCPFRMKTFNLVTLLVLDKRKRYNRAHI